MPYNGYRTEWNALDRRSKGGTLGPHFKLEIASGGGASVLADGPESPATSRNVANMLLRCCRLG